MPTSPQLTGPQLTGPQFTSPVLTSPRLTGSAPGGAVSSDAAPASLAPRDPMAISPGAISAGAISPGAIGPGVVSAGAISPGAINPGAIGPGAISPGALNPGRLTRRAEFLRVAAKGRKAPMPGLVLQALKRQDDAPARLGFTVTKKVGNAVIRNRTRRRLKEAARLLLREQPVAGADLVLIGRDATRARDFAALQQDLRRALAKAGVL